MRVASSVTRAATSGERPLVSFAPSAEMTAVRIICFNIGVAFLTSNGTTLQLSVGSRTNAIAVWAG